MNQCTFRNAAVTLGYTHESVLLTVLKIISSGFLNTLVLGNSAQA